MMINRRKLTSKSAWLLLSIFLLSSFSQSVGAIADEQFYSSNDILFYDKDAKACIATSTSGSVGGISSTDAVNAAVKGADEHKAEYMKAGEANDVPWQLLAAIHYRETAYSMTNPGNGQGLFQFFAEAGKYPPGAVSKEQFAEQVDYAAKKLKTDYSTRGVETLKDAEFTYQNSNSDKVKDTAFSYNGRAGVYAAQAEKLGFDKEKQPYEGSPYVMNFFDDKRDPTKAPNGTWGQILTDGGGISYPANNQIGIYTIYAALGGGTTGSSSGACDDAKSGSGGTLVSIMEAELKIGTKNCSTTTEGRCAVYTDNNVEEWCADFVSWVYKEAGTPFTGGASGGWRIPGVYALDDYLSSKAATYFTPEDTSNKPQPGDVIIFNEGGNQRHHTGLVYTVDGMKITTVEGNMNNSVMSRTFDNYQDGGKIHAFARMK